MRIVIVKDDNTVIVDGEAREVDCTKLPADFHALQWDGARGEVEYSVTRCDHCGARTKKGNALITELGPYTDYLHAWGKAGVSDAAGPQG